MKRLFAHFFTIALFLISATGVFACPCDQAMFQPCEKTYVLPEQLGISDSAIYVQVQGEWYQTKALLNDEGGLYIENIRAYENGCAKGRVPCRNCGRCVKEIYDYCPHCEKPV